MAVPSNKSPIATRPAPNSRNSEIADPLRRSFTGNPFAKPSIVAGSRTPNPNSPATTPSETTPRRSSMGRETVVTFRDSEDKENGKDSGSWKQIRVRSPAAKNFMSPTISAASKINASPRKKILSERNEPGRTSSVSEFKVKSVSFALAPMEDSDHHREVAPTTTPEMVSKPPKPEIGVEAMVPPECPEPVCEKASDCVNLDPSFEISPPPPAAGEASFLVSSGGRVIAPLDADPSAPPPYDPKTNYLSPRPQFLHYRPNPRVEYFLNKDGEGKRLEESFISESFSESEETQSDHSPGEVEDVTSPVEVVKEEEEEKEVMEDEEVPVSEPMPIIGSPITKSILKEVIKESSKPRFSWRSKFTALIMVLAVALFSVLAINSPLTDGLVFKDMSFLKEYKQFEMTELARASFDGLARNVPVWSELARASFDGFARNVQVWSASSMSFINEFISNIRGTKNVGPLQFYNLTLMENGRVNECSVFDQYDKEMEEMGEFDVFEKAIGSAFEVEASVQNSLQEIGAAAYEEPIDQEASLAGIGAAEYGKPVDQEVEQPHIECSEENQPEMGAEAVDKHVEQGNEQVQSAEALEKTSPAAIGATENLVEVHADQEFEEMAAESTYLEEVVSLENNYYADGEVLQATQAITEETVVADYVHSEPERTASIKEEIVSSEVLNLTAEGADSMVSMVSVLGIVFLVLTSVITAIIFMKSRVPANYAAVKPLVTKELAANPIVPVSTEHTYCPSEMSSFQASPVYRSKGLMASDEVESQEKRARKINKRDSLASTDSSMGSPSYGSFTTYERIPVKKGYGEEKIITPVRRSSRIIRKQVTSP
ncbi:PREDICTED: uncharacterized protein LOC101310194 [Fragaria vesca subsp. vesca]|uniref:uncharacterized protein LOC101310194 n=1 Tax=Fragaria vesca subsp. vesca TaxID=101020 RepID=UPI0002C2F4CA|nr:PREDICTED: uncharacterized protein LOC101310194 [Fragaria vesca subsp. vesca]